MIPSNACAGPDPELQQRAALLCRIVRGSPRFLDQLRWWLGFDLARLPRVPDIEHELDEREALLLDAPPGTPVLRREGYLVSTLGGTLLRVAEVTALVRTSALGLDMTQMVTDSRHHAAAPVHCFPLLLLTEVLHDQSRHANVCSALGLRP